MQLVDYRSAGRSRPIDQPQPPTRGGKGVSKLDTRTTGYIPRTEVRSAPRQPAIIEFFRFEVCGGLETVQPSPPMQKPGKEDHDPLSAQHRWWVVVSVHTHE